MTNLLPPLRQFPGVDRRLNSATFLSIVIDIALFCLPCLGERSAELLLRAHDVPLTVASRVLFHADECRANGICHLLKNVNSCESTQINSAANATFQAASDRDKNLGAALGNALCTMMLIHGARVKIDEGFGVLNFEREMLLLRGALELLAIDPDDLHERDSHA